MLELRGVLYDCNRICPPVYALLLLDQRNRWQTCRLELLFGIVDHTAHGVMYIGQIPVLKQDMLQRIPRYTFFPEVQKHLHQVVKLRLARAAAAR